MIYQKSASGSELLPVEVTSDWPAGTWAELKIPHQSGPFTLYLREFTEADEVEIEYLNPKNQKELNKHLVRLLFIGGDKQAIERPELLTKAARGFALMYKEMVRLQNQHRP
ncbi:hypothetical protein ACAW74_25880 [Fibrella sp. WM1]|uniref:hypothetical protein n=1 Tax=Fibrella musci TaxID=3242485 RepID=UPI003520F169